MDLSHEQQIGYGYQTPHTIYHPTCTSGPHIGEEDIRGLIHNTLG